MDWSLFDIMSKSVCLLILRSLQASIFAGFDHQYFTLDRFKLWMFFVKRLLDFKVEPELLSKPQAWQKVLELESQLDWKIKRVSSSIVSR